MKESLKTPYDNLDKLPYGVFKIFYSYSGKASWKLTPNLSCTHANSLKGGISVLGIRIAPSFSNH